MTRDSLVPLWERARAIVRDTASLHAKDGIPTPTRMPMGHLFVRKTRAPACKNSECAIWLLGRVYGTKPPQGPAQHDTTRAHRHAYSSCGGRSRDEKTVWPPCWMATKGGTGCRENTGKAGKPTLATAAHFPGPALSCVTRPRYPTCLRKTRDSAIPRAPMRLRGLITQATDRRENVAVQVALRYAAGT